MKVYTKVKVKVTSVRSLMKRACRYSLMITGSSALVYTTVSIESFQAGVKNKHTEQKRVALLRRPAGISHCEWTLSTQNEKITTSFSDPLIVDNRRKHSTLLKWPLSLHRLSCFPVSIVFILLLKSHWPKKCIGQILLSSIASRYSCGRYCDRIFQRYPLACNKYFDWSIWAKTLSTKMLLILLLLLFVFVLLWLFS